MLRQILALFLFAFSALPGHSAEASPYCTRVSHLGGTYIVCTFDPAKKHIAVRNLDWQGKPYKSFAALARALWADRVFLRFAMNGGMYDDDYRPIGLYVEDGSESKAINRNKGWGNFHLLPNGVFFLEEGRAGVMETEAFAASGIRLAFASQSGPMLVIDGRIHPAFKIDSDSFKKRNGVGVNSRGEAVFVISEGLVRFHDFATLYRDVLGCDNALFLDGTISGIHVPEWGRSDSLFGFGPIITVEERMPP